MKASKYLFLIFMSFAMGVVCHSKTIAWEILPSYSNIQRHGDNSFIVEKNGKYGLVSATGGALLSPEYDFITPFINGYSLVCTGTNESAVINKIISDDGTIYTISRKYYVDTAHPFVSDGLLCVANANSKVGYIDVKGNEVIRCQFDDGLPFKEGWASVKDGRLRKYVNRNYDNNAGRGTLAVNFHFGDMTSASCFNNGQAVIAYNKDFALINTGGNVIRKLNESEAKSLRNKYNAIPNEDSHSWSTSTVFRSEASAGLYNILYNGSAITGYAFDAAPTFFNDNTAIVSYNGQYGIIGIVNGNINISLDTDDNGSIVVDRSGNASPVKYNISLPSGVDNHLIRVFVDAGDGNRREITAHSLNSLSAISGSFKAEFADQASSCSVTMSIYNNGVLVKTTNQTFTVEYPIVLRVDRPRLTSVRADADDYQTVAATIHNDSAKPVTVVATLRVATTDNFTRVSITIPAFSSRDITLRQHVADSFTSTVTISLNTGERASAELQFQKYF